MCRQKELLLVEEIGLRERRIGGNLGRDLGGFWKGFQGIKLFVGLVKNQIG